MSTGKINILDLKGITKTIGPGILYAGAAIGASHLVLSTRAGAMFNFRLIWVVILINLVKYPFFEFAYRYTAATGNNMLDGYRKLGNWAIITFFILSFCTAIINFAAVIKVTSDITAYLIQINLDPFLTSTCLLCIILTMLFIGHYPLLDKVMKAMIFVLGLLTIIAFFFALNKGSQVLPEFTAPPAWDTVGITFMIVLMGWMPTPIDASIWPSLWAIERRRQTQYKPNFKEYEVDFHLGYIGSAVLALFFLGLGALAMYGTGNQFSSNGLEFSKQLVQLYTGSIGKWSTEIMGLIVFITMFSTAYTVIDGYPRSLEASLFEIFPSTRKLGSKMYYLWAILLSIAAVIIIGFFTKNMVALLKFATIISFLTAPVFAFINLKVVTSNFIPKEAHPRIWLKILSWAGLVFLVFFSIIFLFYHFRV